MFKRCIPSIALFTMICLIVVPIAKAQDKQDPKTTNSDAETEKRQLLQTKTLALVDSLAASIQDLKLPENRVRAGSALGNVLWALDPDRSRKLFRQSETTLAAMEQAITTDDPQWTENVQNVIQLRSEIVQMIVNNDPQLAMEFLIATRMPSGIAPQWAKTGDVELETQITQVMAATDPAAALTRAEEALAKGLSWNLTNVVAQLLQKDPPKAAILADEIAEKIGSEDFMTQQSPGSGILMNILGMASQYQVSAEQRSGNNQTIIDGPGVASVRQETLPDATFKKLLDLLVNAALTADLSYKADQNERAVAFGILSWMINQDALLQKYESAHSAEIQKKIAQYQQMNGGSNGVNLNQLAQTATPDAIVKAAANAPSAERNNYYYQASQKASTEGNLDLATRIIDDNIKEPSARDQGFLNLSYNFVNSGKLDQAEDIIENKIEDVGSKNNALAYINDRKFRINVEQSKLDDALALVGHLPLPQQIDKLSQIAATMAQKGQKQDAVMYLDRAWSLLPTKAANSPQLQLQINLTMAFAQVDQNRAAGYLQSIITQLNDLLRAAEALNAFDVNYYKDGELTMQGGSLQSMVRQCGSTFAAIAVQDFDQAKTLSDLFERPEAKIMAQLIMVTQLMQTQTLRVRIKSGNNYRVWLDQEIRIIKQAPQR